MFNKIVAVNNVNLVPEAREELKKYAQQTIFYSDSPADEAELVERIGDAQAVLVGYTTRIERSAIEQCRDLKYIGMCCSLYSEESANVDIPAAREHGIIVKGIRDYGDRGVVEYVINQLTSIMHGFGYEPYYGKPREIYGLNVGMVGFGVSGRMIAGALKFLGANVSYYCRSPKEDVKDMQYKPLKQLLRESEVVCTCLNKNVILLNKDEFEALGNGKLLFNTSIGPGFDTEELEKWLDNDKNHFFCDTKGAAGSVSDLFFERKNVHCVNMSSGMTIQAYKLLSDKVLDNIKSL